MKKLVFIHLIVLGCAQCGSHAGGNQPNNIAPKQEFNPKAEIGVITGADQLEILLSKIETKHVALVVNYTAVVGKTHLADTLKAHGVFIKKIFSPEHGFRGTATAGEHVKDGFDTKTGLPVVSLYGKNRRPTAAQLDDVDLVIFDIQDVGVRFFTYIGTLHYVMEACAENGKKLIVLDRPNPERKLY